MHFHKSSSIYIKVNFANKSNHLNVNQSIAVFSYLVIKQNISLIAVKTSFFLNVFNENQWKSNFPLSSIDILLLKQNEMVSMNSQ